MPMIELTYEVIPEDPDFSSWARDHEFLKIDVLAGGRRGWCSTLSSYIRNHNCVLYIDGEPIGFYMQDELPDCVKVAGSPNGR